MLTGDTKAMDGHVDRRGGIIWHTQGSGKSLTMVFLIRAMRGHPELRRFKIVLVTDRTDLQSQLGDTAALTGETVKVARNANAGEGAAAPARAGRGDGDDPEVPRHRQRRRRRVVGRRGVRDAERVRVDPGDGRRGAPVARLGVARQPDGRAANAARIGFTGTPIIMGKRKKTLEIFGGYLDQYTLTESEADGSTVPIFYEGRTTEAAVAGASKMDDVFFRWFAELTDEQREMLQTKYATTAQVLEAPEMIAAKARDILRHYVGTVMPDGFKGMIVATSRQACVRYYDALNAARDELVAEIEAFVAERRRSPVRPARRRRAVPPQRRRAARPAARRSTSRRSSPATTTTRRSITCGPTSSASRCGSTCSSGRSARDRRRPTRSRS